MQFYSSAWNSFLPRVKCRRMLARSAPPVSSLEATAESLTPARGRLRRRVDHGMLEADGGGYFPPPPPSRTKWARLVHPSVLIGHGSVSAAQRSALATRTNHSFLHASERRHVSAPPPPPPPFRYKSDAHLTSAPYKPDAHLSPSRTRSNSSRVAPDVVSARLASKASLG